jgi:hypothetical protein
MKRTLKTEVRRIIRWGSSIPLLGLALLYLNSAAFSFWAAGGPPTPNPKEWIARGNHHFFIAMALGILALIIIWLFRPRAWR